MKEKDIPTMLKEQKEWKDFEKCLLPILKNCEACEEYGTCFFHENWYYHVKNAFDKFRSNIIIAQQTKEAHYKNNQKALRKMTRKIK